MDATSALRAANERALLVRLQDRTSILVRGKDRSSWLNGLVTCDLAKLGESGGAYGLLVEKKGKIQTDFYVAQDASSLALAVPSDLRETVLATLDHYLIMEDAELVPSDHTFFLLVGPASADVAKTASQSSDTLSHRGTLDLLGKGGMVVAGLSGDALERSLVSAGATLADATAWDAVRIEHGLPRFGVEADATMYPQEAALERIGVSFSKGCYLGQEVVYMLENRGHVKKKLVGLAIEGAGEVAAGAEVVTADGESVGAVKSAVVSPSDPSRLASIAMIKFAQAKPGTELRVSGRVARVRA